MPRDKIQLGKFYIAVVSCTLGQLLLWIVIMGPRAEVTTIMGVPAFLIIFVVFFYLFHEGYNWSRWLLIVLLVLVSGSSLIDGYVTGDVASFLCGLLHLASLIFVFLAGRTRRQEPLPVIDMDADDVEDE